MVIVGPLRAPIASALLPFGNHIFLKHGMVSNCKKPLAVLDFDMQIIILGMSMPACNRMLMRVGKSLDALNSCVQRILLRPLFFFCMENRLAGRKLQ